MDYELTTFSNGFQIHLVVFSIIFSFPVRVLNLNLNAIYNEIYEIHFKSSENFTLNMLDLTKF